MGSGEVAMFCARSRAAVGALFRAMKALLVSVLLCLTASADLYELRTYTPAEGKLEALESRFRDHTLALFESHGMKNIGYWLTAKREGEAQKLVYLVAHEDQEAADASWEAFRKDPKWIAARDASQVDGSLVKKVESQYLTATDYSKLK